MPQKHSKNKSHVLIFWVIAAVIIGSPLSIVFPKKTDRFGSQIAGNTPTVVFSPQTNPSQKSIQLQALKFISVTPPPTKPPQSAPQPTAKPALNYCPHHTGLCYSKNTCDCNGGVQWTCHFSQCVDEFGVNNNEHYDCNSAAENVCTACAGIPDGKVCLGKPVIFLYPTKDTLVNVNVVTSGKIVLSDPKYPEEGWKNVLAKPSGELAYQSKTYHELFYESNVENFAQPENGIIIPSSNLRPEIKKLIFKLGLNDAESGEFLDFWIPKLENLKSNYILFSILSAQLKESIDRVDITPKPDTRIEFIAYFRPLDFPIAVEPLILPSRPERIGFTEVEWGGTIGTNSSETILY